jgi:hypothetical protein
MCFSRGVVRNIVLGRADGDHEYIGVPTTQGHKGDRTGY